MAHLAQFIGRPDLSESREGFGQYNDGVLDFLTDAILVEWLVTTIVFREGVDTAGLIGLLDVVEVLSAYPHHPTGFRDILEQTAKFK
jgi:hypothetical protein